MRVREMMVPPLVVTAREGQNEASSPLYGEAGEETFLGQDGDPGRAPKGQVVAVGEVSGTYRGGRMTRSGAGRPGTTARRPRWFGMEASITRFNAAGSHQ